MKNSNRNFPQQAMGSERTRVLLIEDNPVDARFYRQMLERPKAGELAAATDFDVVVADHLAAGLEQLGCQEFDVVLLDLTLPDSRGLETFERLHTRAPDVPVVVLTSDTDEGMAITAVQKGAQDYLVKGLLRSNILVRFVRYAMERHRLLEDVRRFARETEAREARIRGIMTRLERGFERLSAGDFTVRVSGGDGRDGDGEELASLLTSFDRTVEQLQMLSELNAQFHSMAAHDMRSPLTSLTLAISALRQQTMPPDKERVLLDSMGRQVEKMIRLLDSLLDYFIVTAGEVHLLYEDVDVNEVLADCARDLEPQAAQRGHRLAVGALEGDAVVRCDRMKLARVLENLVGNAIKYSRAADTIVLSAQPGGDGEIRFDVADSGPGIAPEDRLRIFERFHRAPQRDRKISGSGLGLAICKDYVGAHGGRIWVECDGDGGSRFSFVVPRKPPANASPEKPDAGERD